MNNSLSPSPPVPQSPRPSNSQLPTPNSQLPTLPLPSLSTNNPCRVRETAHGSIGIRLALLLI
ncbi:hypothetical protein, partial [Chamaesiphon sp. OTE_20_metabat_361]|uniref:hypothetical protein n=1 Tax=Chamaesiphon sp. OTE_20_metabat_361 TaxID=2964689 RepID=UPI00286A42C8